MPSSYQEPAKRLFPSITIPLSLLILLSGCCFQTIQAASLINNLPYCSLTRRSFLTSTSTTAALSTMSQSTTTNNNNDQSSSSSSPPIRWGIIGLGDVTTIKSGPPFFHLGSTGSLVAVMQRTPHAAADWISTMTSRYDNNNNSSGSITPYDDLDSFLAHEGLDAVYIATPPGSHLHIASKVANANKHCYIEKPVGRCGYETKAIYDAFQQKGNNAVLYPAYISRVYKRTLTIQDLVFHQQIIGKEITSIVYRMRGSGLARGMDNDDNNNSIPWRVDAKHSGGGLIMDMGCHLLNRLDMWFGPLVNVKGLAERRNENSVGLVEDYVELKAEIGGNNGGLMDGGSGGVSAKGAVVDCIWDFSGEEEGGNEDQLIITGDGGSIRMAAMSLSLPVELYDKDGTLVQTIEFETVRYTAGEMIQRVTNDLRRRRNDDDDDDANDDALLSTGEDALRTSRVLDQVLEGYYGGRDDEFWKRSDSWPGLHKQI